MRIAAPPESRGGLEAEVEAESRSLSVREAHFAFCELITKLALSITALSLCWMPSQEGKAT